MNNPSVDTDRPGHAGDASLSGSAAEQAGLQAGDVIHSANGYVTQEHGNLAWIISTVPSNGVLQMNVRKVRDGATRVVAAAPALIGPHS